MKTLVYAAPVVKRLKLWNLNFHPLVLEVVFRYRDPQLKITHIYTS